MMKRFLLFLSMLLLAVTLLLERSGLLWEYERPVVHFLARATHRRLPCVTAVKMTLTQSLLTPQDVALTLRAIISFQPQQILVAEPLGDLSNGPLSLVREAQETGELQQVPVFFATASKTNKDIVGSFADVLVFPEETPLPSLPGKGVMISCFGFINQENHALPFMPLVARDADEKVMGSLWWKSLFSLNPSSRKSVLLEGRLLFLPSHRTIALEKGGGLCSQKTKEGSTVLLEDLLLHREEMERGAIRADLDPLFRGKTVLLGGADVSRQAGILQDAQEQFSVEGLSAPLYGALLLLLSFFMLLVRPLPWIDFLLSLMGLLFLYGGSGYWLFRSSGVLLPLFFPIVLVVIAIVKKLPSCTPGIKK